MKTVNYAFVSLPFPESRFCRNCLPPMLGALILALGGLFSSTAASQTLSGPADEKNKTVVDMSAAELLKSYPKELSHLQFDRSQDSLKDILKKVGDNVEAFFRNFANTSSTEQVYMMRYSSKRQFRGLELPDTWFEEFHYLILPHSGSAGVTWIEDRADKANRPVQQKTVSGFIMSSGHAGLCMYLHPDHQANSCFRYLGRETKKPFAHVIAFAQKPESKDYLSEFFDVTASVSIRFLVQGFVWLDPDSYQILHMRTSMLSPEKQTALKATATDIYYEPVQFGGTQRQFWLPREVDVSWEFPDLTFRNQHKYSDYHVFSVESDYKIMEPKPNK